MKLRHLSTFILVPFLISMLMGFSTNSASASENPINMAPMAQKKSDVSTADMLALIKQFKENGEISNANAARLLKTHVTSVGHFANEGTYTKAVKHMGDIHVLLNHQLANGEISEDAANSLSDYGDTLINKWNVQFDANRVMDTDHHLSVNIGPRVAGTTGEKDAAQYLKSQYDKLGLETTIQEFPIRDRTERSLTIQTDDNKEVALGAASGSPSTDKNGVTGGIFNAGLGEPNDFTNQAAGKIALVKKGKVDASDQVQNAMKAGAIGVVIYDNADSFHPLRLRIHDSDIPVVGTTKEEGEYLLGQLSKGNVKATLTIYTHKNQTSQNVIAVRKAKGVVDPDIVYITSHYDSVPYSPGGNDDGSGTATVVEMARILKDFPTDKELRFINFGAEELGMVGSFYYVDHLPKADLDRSLINFQFEMMGAKYEPGSYLTVNTVDGNKNVTWDYTASSFDKLGKNKDKLILFKRGQSDHVPFYNAGITATCFNMGTSTGGLEPEYHTYHDTFDNVSKDRIKFAGDITRTAIWDYLTDHSYQLNGMQKASQF